MISRKIAVAVVAVGAAASSVFTVSTASAATPTSVAITAGTAASGTTVTFNVTGGAIALKDLTTGIGGSCTSSSLTGGTLKVGSGQGPNGTPAGTGTAQIPGTSSTTSYSGCKAAIGTANFPFTFSGNSATGSPWRLRDDSTTVNGETSKTIFNINILIVASSCSFSVTGSISNSVYKNTSPGTMVVPAVTSAAASNLTVSNLTLRNGAATCLGGAVSANGDKMSFATTYSVSATTSSQNPIADIAT